MKKSTVEIMKAFTEGKNLLDCGLCGKAFEVGVRSYIMQRIVKAVKSQGKNDIQFTYEGKRYTCEIKSACGEIETLESSQYIIYAPTVDIDKTAESQGFVFTREEWRAFVNGYTGRGKFLRIDEKRGHTHIQSFYVSETIRPKASKPIANYIWETCSTLPTVEEFFGK